MKSLGKIVHLSSVHPTNDNRIFHKECKSLALAGYDVTLIAVSDLEFGAPDKDFTEDGVKVRGIRKFANRPKRIFLAPWIVYKMALEEDADIYHFHDPELIPIGLLLWLQGYKIVYDVHDNYYEEMLSKKWIYPFLRAGIAGLFHVVEQIGSFCFNGIVVANPPTARRFAKVSHKTISLNNFALLKEMPKANIYDVHDIPKNLAYIGFITEKRSAVEMVSAMELLEDSSLRLLLGGTCLPENLKERLEKEDRRNRTVFLGWLSRNDVVDTLKKSFIGLCILHSTPNYLMNYPTKIFEYMGMGMPVIGNQFEVMREIIETHQCGLTVPEKDSYAIANAIQWLFDHPHEAIEMGRRGRQAIETQYNWESEMKKLLNLYGKILYKP